MRNTTWKVDWMSKNLVFDKYLDSNGYISLNESLKI